MKSSINRFLLALVLAPTVTIFLLWGMQTLISGGENALSDAPKGNVLDFIRLKKEETVTKKERKPEKPPKPETPPPPMEQPQMAQANPNADAVSNSFTAEVTADTGLSGGLKLGDSDGEYMPLSKIAAVYPRRARSRGIEGYVIVEFTVTKLGTVESPVIIEAKPESIFDRAALDSVMKYKYKPRVVDGEAVPVAGVQTKVSFEIDG